MNALSPQEFSRRIDANKRAVVDRFIDRAKLNVPAAEGESRAFIQDHLPQVLDRMIGFLRQGGDQLEFLSSASLAEQHGAQRATSPRYTLKDLRLEFSLLRQCLLELLKPDEVLTTETWDMFGQVSDAAVSSATEEFVRNSTRELIEGRAVLDKVKGQQAWLENILNNLPMPLLLLSTGEQKVSFTNLAAKALVGAPYENKNPKEFYGTSIRLKDVAGRDLPGEDFPSARALRGEKFDNLEVQAQTPAGRFHVKAQSEVVGFAAGHPETAILLLQDVTAMKAAEAALTLSEERLTQALRTSKIGFWRVELPSEEMVLNSQMAEDWGLDASAKVGTLRAGLSRIHPEDRDRIAKAVEESTSKLKPYLEEYRVIRPDGEIVWIEARGETIINSHGLPGVFSGTSLNITDRVMARQQIEASAHEFKRLADSMPQIVWTADASGQLHYFNKVWFEYSGTDFQANVGEGWISAVHPEDIPATIQKWKKAVATGERYENEFRLLAKSGEYRWHVARATADRDASGTVRKWYGTNTDIHEQKVIYDLLQANKERLEFAMASAGIVTWYLDLSNMKLSTSSGGDETEGVAAVAPRDVSEFIGTYVHPDDKKRVEECIKDAVAQRRDYLDEYRILRPDGAVRWIRSTGRARYPTGTEAIPPHMTGIVLDITDEKVRNEQVETARKIAEAANNAKSQFLANMSHEIRTPLGAIMGFSRLLKEEGLSRADRDSYLSVVERNSTQLLRIIDDILDLSKVEAGMMLIESIEFSLPELLTDFSSLMGFKARENGISFVSKAATPLPKTILSDPTRIRQILMNVVGNAIKFTSHGEVQLIVSFHDRQLEFEVRDTGRGISREQIPNLFQPFSQADASTTRKYGGTGLGLVLTRSLSEAMGGFFELKSSEIDKGSVFVASVAVEISEQTTFASNFTNALGFSSEPVRSSIRPGVLSGLHVLLVEDSPDNQALISIYLNRAGASVDIGSDGEQGYQLAVTGNYDVVLMDVQMPIMDGIATVRKLRASGYGRPVIALTAHAMKEERIRCIEAGFDDFLSKPIARDELIETLTKRSFAKPEKK